MKPGVIPRPPHAGFSMIFSSFRFLLLAATLLLLSPACSDTPPECSPDTCLGCCSSTGECLDGDRDDACGYDGVACEACLNPEKCVANVLRAECEIPGPLIETDCTDLLDNDGDGLIDCFDPDCVEGSPFCEAEFYCDDGFDNDADGLIDCDDPDCAEFEHCQAPCGPANCDGCCTAEGACVVGTSAAACGAGGVSCEACTDGYTCNDFFGEFACGPEPCGPQSCAGCCAGPFACLAGTSGLACGSGGEACVTCSPSETCESEGGLSTCAEVVYEECGRNVHWADPLSPLTYWVTDSCPSDEICQCYTEQAACAMGDGYCESTEGSFRMTVIADVAESKEGGAPWDIGSPPDPYFELWRDGMLIETSPTVADAFTVFFNSAAFEMGPGVVMRVMVYDEDPLDDDVIGGCEWTMGTSSFGRYVLCDLPQLDLVAFWWRST
jgi:hypothetical protein